MLRTAAHELEFQAERRSRSYTDPRNWFEPDFVTPEIVMPLVRPLHRLKRGGEHLSLTAIESEFSLDSPAGSRGVDI
jgi:hypothetical protein